MSIKNPAIKRIRADVAELSRHPSSRYHAAPLEDNMFEWHFTIRGPKDSDFEGGIYHGRILLPAEYPFKPPNFIFLTKNGRFEVGTKICLSISAYHEESWQPAWGVRTMLEAIISFLPTEGAGAIGALDWTKSERQRLARESHKYCCPQCGLISELLSEDIEESMESEKSEEKDNGNDNSASKDTNAGDVDMAARLQQLQLSYAESPNNSPMKATNSNNNNETNNDNNNDVIKSLPAKCDDSDHSSSIENSANRSLVNNIIFSNEMKSNNISDNNNSNNSTNTVNYDANNSNNHNVNGSKVENSPENNNSNNNNNIRSISNNSNVNVVNDINDMKRDVSNSRNAVTSDNSTSPIRNNNNNNDNNTINSTNSNISSNTINSNVNSSNPPSLAETRPQPRQQQQQQPSDLTDTAIQVISAILGFILLLLVLKKFNANDSDHHSAEL